MSGRTKCNGSCKGQWQWDRTIGDMSTMRSARVTQRRWSLHPHSRGRPAACSLGAILSQNLKLNFNFSPKVTLSLIPETNMVGIRLEWSPLANYNICYWKNIFIYSSGNYEANKIEHRAEFVIVYSRKRQQDCPGKVRWGAAANAASVSLSTSHSATIRSPGLASHARCHIVTFS